MTPEERIILLEKIEDIAGEHLDAYVFIAKVDADDGDPVVFSKWDGGRAHALGLMDHMSTQIRAQIFKEENEL